MKNIKLAPASAIALGLAFAGAASAQSQNAGTITFTGSVADNTCIVQGGAGTNGGATNFTVALDRVQTTQLAAAAATAGAKSFKVILGGPGSGNCPVTTVASFAFDSSSTAIDGTTGALKNVLSGEATNTQIQLLAGSATGTPINLFNAYSVDFPALVNNTAEIGFGARYLAVNGAATAGAVRSDILYRVTYN